MSWLGSHNKKVQLHAERPEDPDNEAAQLLPSDGSHQLRGLYPTECLKHVFRSTEKCPQAMTSMTGVIVRNNQNHQVTRDFKSK